MSEELLNKLKYSAKAGIDPNNLLSDLRETYIDSIFDSCVKGDVIIKTTKTFWKIEDDTFVVVDYEKSYEGEDFLEESFEVKSFKKIEKVFEFIPAEHLKSFIGNSNLLESETMLNFYKTFLKIK